MTSRSYPAEGVFIFRNQPTIAFLTVCTQHRERLLAHSKARDCLVASWREASAWLVGFYLIMPDHVHLFCAPQNEDYTIEQWITFWKRRFRTLYGDEAPRFQTRGFQLRRDENYSVKWEYVRANPVRAGLVENADDWPYQGVIHDLRW